MVFVGGENAADDERVHGLPQDISVYKIFKNEHPDERDPLEIFYEKAMKVRALEDPNQNFEVTVEIYGFLAKEPVKK